MKAEILSLNTPCGDNVGEGVRRSDGNEERIQRSDTSQGISSIRSLLLRIEDIHLTDEWKLERKIKTKL